MRIALNASKLYEISIIAFSYIPILMGVSIVAYESSKHIPSDESAGKNTFIIVVQYLLYYTTMIISFFANPFLNEFQNITHENPSTPLSNRLKQSLKKLAIYYGVLGGLAVLAFISILVSPVKIDFGVILGILPSILNLYGLIMYIFAIGFGIVKYPLYLISNAQPVNQLREYLTEIDDISNERHITEPIQTHKQNLLVDCKILYDNIIQLKIHRKPIKVAKCVGQYIFAVITFSFSILHIANECSYGYRENSSHFVLRIILLSFNNQILCQIFLYLYIGLLVSIAAHILTCINFRSLFPKMVGNILAKAFNMLEYKFVKDETAPKTFEHWSTYLQRLVPTIAYHCQLMSGVKGTSLERLFGQLNHFDIFTALVKLTLPSFLLLIIVFVIFLSCDLNYDKAKVSSGLVKFKRQLNIVGGPNLDNYIINNYFDRDQLLRNFQAETETNDEISIQLSSVSSFQSAAESQERADPENLNSNLN